MDYLKLKSDYEQLVAIYQKFNVNQVIFKNQARGELIAGRDEIIYNEDLATELEVEPQTLGDDSEQMRDDTLLPFYR